MKKSRLASLGLVITLLASSSLVGCTTKNVVPEVKESMKEETSSSINTDDKVDTPTDSVVDIVETERNEEVLGAEQMSVEELQMLIRDKSYEQASELLKADENSNYSAFSLYYAMSMLGLGADDETKDSIDKFLGADFSEYTDGLTKLMENFNSEESPFSIANAEFVDDNVELNDEYKSVIEDKLLADIKTIDFSNEAEANAAINSWISEKTRGMIKEGMGVSSQDVMDIINAVYFKDSWSLFDEEATDKSEFTLTDGSKVEVDMMHANRREDVAYFKGDGYSRVTIPMDNSRFEVVLPDGKELNELMEDLEETFSGGNVPNNNYVVNISLPKFKFETSASLNDFLVNNGLGNIFSGEANFNKLGSMENGDSLKVGNVGQKTAVEVNEKGVEASAVTEITMRAMSAQKPEDEPEIIDFIVDKAVLFSIVSDGGIPMFIGVLANPIED